MNRNTALNIIRAEFAEHGKPTQASTRAYVENRIGFAAYTTAAWEGMGLYFEAQKHD